MSAVYFWVVTHRTVTRYVGGLVDEGWRSIVTEIQFQPVSKPQERVVVRLVGRVSGNVGPRTHSLMEFGFVCIFLWCNNTHLFLPFKRMQNKNGTIFWCPDPYSLTVL